MATGRPRSLSRISSVPLASTARPGRNLSVAGFGVGSVWMNMARSSPRAGSKAYAKDALFVIVIGGAAGRKFKTNGNRGPSWPGPPSWRLCLSARRWALCLGWSEFRVVKPQARAAADPNLVTGDGAGAAMASRHRIEVFIAEMAGHDRHRNGKVAGVLAEAGNKRARPFLAGGRRRAPGSRCLHRPR